MGKGDGTFQNPVAFLAGDRPLAVAVADLDGDTVPDRRWWGEGEIKFYLDQDDEFPTICGTGTEDYCCGSYNFDLGEEAGGYTAFTTPYARLQQILRPDGRYRSQQRFGMYRWHIPDPVRFRERLRVTIQALGRSGPRYNAL